MPSAAETPLPAASATARRHVWERWEIVWHVGALVCLGVGTAFALLGAPSAVDAGRIVGVAGATTVWYWALRGAAGNRLPVRLLHLAGTAVGAFALSLEHPAYLSLAGFLCGHAFVFLPIRWGIATAVVLSAAMAAMLSTAFGSGAFIAVSILTVVAVLMGLYIHSIIEQSAHRQQLIDDLEATRRELARSERAAGVVAERQRLAREIHDTVTQDIVSALRLIESALRMLPESERAVADCLELAQRAAREGLAESRRLIWATRPGATRSSLPDALARACDRCGRESGANARLSLPSEIGSLPTELEVTLLRVAQETLANVARHARASNVVVTLSYIGSVVALDVHDDGIGFDPATVRPQLGVSGFGLTGLRERVEELGGDLTVDSAPGEGTTIGVNIPIPGDSQWMERDGE